MLVHLPIIVVHRHHVTVSIGSIFMAGISTKVDIIILNDNLLLRSGLILAA